MLTTQPEMSSRDAALIHVFGTEKYTKIRNSKVLLVGAGGIGCEVLKNLVLGGFRHIEVVDLDTIDLSNLNRQFLFSMKHVSQSKAHVARQTALEFNPECDIVSYHDNIKSKQFDVEWFRTFDFVVNALDNADARRHVNMMCLASNRPLIESATGGYLGQCKLLLRNVTECYECSPKPAQKTYPICTIRSTPSQPIHCIVWAKSYLLPKLFGKDEDALDETETDDNKDEIAALRKEQAALQELLNSKNQPDFNRRVFTKVFTTDVERLVSMEDMWKDRTPPKPLTLSGSFGKKRRRDLDTEHEIPSLEDSISLFLSSLDQLKGREEVAWEKDDDDVMDFVFATTNLRAHIYNIPVLSRFKIKEMAGNIIPAVATTNAMIAGFVTLTAYKILEGDISGTKSVAMQYKWSDHTAHSIGSNEKPNPDCAACSQSYMTLVCDAEQTTLGDVVEICSKFGEVTTIIMGKSIVYDLDFEDKVGENLKSLGVAPDAPLDVTVEKDDQDMRSIVFVVDRPGVQGSELSGDQEFKLVKSTIPTEPEPVQKVIKSNKVMEID